MKPTLTADALQDQLALELPNRDLLALINVVIFNVLNDLSVSIPIKNNNVAVQVCAVVDALNSNIGTNLTCTVTLGQ